MGDKVLVLAGPGMGAALMEAMLLADRGSSVPMIDAMAREQAIRLGTDPMDEMLMRMLMPEPQRRRQFEDDMRDLVLSQIESILARRPRPFRPTGNKRARRRRKG